MENVGKRNGKIDLLRFLFALFIMILHYGWYPEFHISTIQFGLGQNGGYAVVFFFLVSGVFFALSVERDHRQISIAEATKQFMVKKYVYFIKWFMIAFVLFALRDLVVNGLVHFLKNVFYSLPYFLFLGELGFDDKTIYANGYYVNASWYLSALFCCFLVLYPLVRSNYEAFIKILAPIIFMVSLSIDFTISHSLTTGKWAYPLAMITLGCMLYNARDLINNLQCRTILIELFEIIVYGMTFLYMCSGAEPLSEFPMMILLATAVMITVSGRTYHSVFNHRIFEFLGKMSFPLYLLHVPVLRWTEVVFKMMKWDVDSIARIILSYIMSLVVAAIGITIESRYKRSVS